MEENFLLHLAGHIKFQVISIAIPYLNVKCNI